MVADVEAAEVAAVRERQRADIDAALSALEEAQRNGDFAAQGQALENLQAAVEAYQRAEESSASASPTG